MAADPTKRVSLNIPRELADRVSNHLPWGLQNQVYIKLTEILLDQLDEHGLAVVTLLLEEHLTLTAKESAYGRSGRSLSRAGSEE